MLKVCSVLGIDPDVGGITDVADDAHGGYSLGALKDYVGQYRAFRRSLLFPKYILRSGFEFSWHKASKTLRFKEHQRYRSLRDGELVDRSQQGEIFVGSQSGLLHLLTADRGALRLVTLRRFRLRNPADKSMHGMLLTQARNDSTHIPSAAAIYLEKLETKEKNFENYAKEIDQKDGDYKKVDIELTSVERHGVNFVLRPQEDNG